MTNEEFDKRIARGLEEISKITDGWIEDNPCYLSVENIAQILTAMKEAPKKCEHYWNNTEENQGKIKCKHCGVFYTEFIAALSRNLTPYLDVDPIREVYDDFKTCMEHENNVDRHTETERRLWEAIKQHCEGEK